jgi:hypothetical protein
MSIRLISKSEEIYPKIFVHEAVEKRVDATIGARQVMAEKVCDSVHILVVIRQVHSELR